jgi:hypothetical protein
VYQFQSICRRVFSNDFPIRSVGYQRRTEIWQVPPILIDVVLVTEAKHAVPVAIAVAVVLPMLMAIDVEIPISILILESAI